MPVSSCYRKDTVLYFMTKDSQASLNMRWEKEREHLSRPFSHWRIHLFAVLIFTCHVPDSRLCPRTVGHLMDNMASAEGTK